MNERRYIDCCSLPPPPSLSLSFLSAPRFTSPSLCPSTSPPLPFFASPPLRPVPTPLLSFSFSALFVLPFVLPCDVGEWPFQKEQTKSTFKGFFAIRGSDFQNGFDKAECCTDSYIYRLKRQYTGITIPAANAALTSP